MPEYKYFSEMLETEFLPRFILLGLSVESFWDLTPREIRNVIKQYNKDRDYNLRMQSRIAYTLAIMVSEGSVGKLRDYHVYFPRDNSSDLGSKDMEIKRNLLNYANATRKTRANNGGGIHGRQKSVGNKSHS